MRYGFICSAYRHIDARSMYLLTGRWARGKYIFQNVWFVWKSRTEVLGVKNNPKFYCFKVFSQLFFLFSFLNFFLQFCDLPKHSILCQISAPIMATPVRRFAHPWPFGSQTEALFKFKRLHFLFYFVLFPHMLISTPPNVSTPAASFPAPVAEDPHAAAVRPDLLAEIRSNTTSVTRVTTCM